MAAPRISALSRRAVFAGILLFGLLAMTARPALDPDLWWHLRTGQWIMETRTVPHTDPFSFTRAGQAWISHEWLSEVLFYSIWRHAGFGGLIVFSAVITTFAFMLLYLRCDRIPHWAAAATAVGAVASAPAWGMRPQMFTFALTSLLFWLLERGEERPKIVLFVPPLFLLWVNLHAGFALGAALLLAYASGMLMEVALGETRWVNVRASLFRILTLLVVCVALVPLNPSGTQLYRYPFDTLRSSAMRTVIVEWFSADFHKARYFPYLVLWLLLLAVLAVGKYRPKGRVLVPLIVTAGLSLDAVRHIPIFVLLAVPVIAKGLSIVAESPVVEPSRRKLPRPEMAVIALVLLAGFALTRWGVLIRDQASGEREQFPEKALVALESGDFGGQLFAYYDWGGYAIFKLYPKYRVFVDGRADLYGAELLREFQTVVQLRGGWKQVVDGWNLRVVLVPPRTALAQALTLDADWRTEYRDSQALLLVREIKSSKNGGIVTKASPSSRKSAKMVGEETAYQRDWGMTSAPIPLTELSDFKNRQLTGETGRRGGRNPSTGGGGYVSIRAIALGPR